MDDIAIKSNNYKTKIICDPRGGWNRYKFRVDFFKKWSNEMAYLLGFLYADGNIDDAKVSSRCQYVKFSNKEREIIEKIKRALKSEHPIHFQPPRTSVDKNGHLYRSSKSFYLRLGSKKLFADLIKLGLIPHKSKVVKFPSVPIKYLGHFLRGYFDGDGNVYISRAKSKNGQKILIKNLRITFVSGSKIFLEGLCSTLKRALGLKQDKVYKGHRSFQLVYSTSDSVELFKFLYKSFSKKLCLERKFWIFSEYFELRPNKIDEKVKDILSLGHVVK